MPLSASSHDGDVWLNAIDCIAPAPGRSLRWAPDWDDSNASVLFDRNSGDFWVLEPNARAVIRSLEAGRSLSVSQLRGLLGGRQASPELQALLGALMRCGLIRAWDNAGRTLTAPESPDID